MGSAARSLHPLSTLDPIFYVRGGKFYVSVRRSVTKSRRAACRPGRSAPGASGDWAQAAPKRNNSGTAFSPILVVMVQAACSGRRPGLDVLCSRRTESWCLRSPLPDLRGNQLAT